jgi:hypothetical protein
MLFNDEFHIVINENVIEGHISCSEGKEAFPGSVGACGMTSWWCSGGTRKAECCGGLVMKFE